jgi:guanylate kinase
MGTIVSITGVTGAGKTTLAREIISKRPNARMVESITTRPRRPSDIPGEYRYVPLEEFAKLDAAKEFLWTAEHGGTHYGTMCSSILNTVAGKNMIGLMILVPDVLEHLRVFLRSSGHDHTPIFLATPSMEVLYQRVAKRGDDLEIFKRRYIESMGWEKAAEVSRIPFHFVANNGSIQETVTEVLTFL